ncbi:hypothetical protein ACOMHN_002189 [Nucella lapillus]
MCTLFSTLLISGTVYFDSQDDGTVRVTGTITGLSPGEHAFHIHAIGFTDDCYKAGGHFDTANKSHGGPTDENRSVIIFTTGQSVIIIIFITIIIIIITIIIIMFTIVR